MLSPIILRCNCTIVLRVLIYTVFDTANNDQEVCIFGLFVLLLSDLCNIYKVYG